MIRYIAGTDGGEGGDRYAVVSSDDVSTASDRLALRHARAMKAVLVAAKAAKRAHDAYILGGGEAAQARRSAAGSRLERAIVRLQDAEKALGGKS